MSSSPEVENKKRKVEEGTEDNEHAPEAEVTIADGYEEGNITLVGDENVGFRIWDYYLRARSSVFRSMLDTCDNHDRVIRIPNTSQKPLACFVRALLDNPPSPHPDDFTAAIELCDKYDSPSAAKLILSSVLDRKISPSNFDFRNAFALACKLRDVGSGSRILALQRNYEARAWKECKRNVIPRIGLWNRQEAEQLSVGWFFALSRAADEVRSEDAYYWSDLAALFAEELR